MISSKLFFVYIKQRAVIYVVKLIKNFKYSNELNTQFSTLEAKKIFIRLSSIYSPFHLKSKPGFSFSLQKSHHTVDLLKFLIFTPENFSAKTEDLSSSIDKFCFQVQW